LSMSFEVSARYNAEPTEHGVGQRATATIDFGTTGKVRLMLVGGVPMTKL